MGAEEVKLFFALARPFAQGPVHRFAVAGSLGVDTVRAGLPALAILEACR
jgi:hypothetical protein